MESLHYLDEDGELLSEDGPLVNLADLARVLASATEKPLLVVAHSVLKKLAEDGARIYCTQPLRYAEDMAKRSAESYGNLLLRLWKEHWSKAKRFEDLYVRCNDGMLTCLRADVARLFPELGLDSVVEVAAAVPTATPPAPAPSTVVVPLRVAPASPAPEATPTAPTVAALLAPKPKPVKPLSSEAVALLEKLKGERKAGDEWTQAQLENLFRLRFKFKVQGAQLGRAFGFTSQWLSQLVGTENQWRGAPGEYPPRRIGAPPEALLRECGLVGVVRRKA